MPFLGHSNFFDVGIFAETTRNIDLFSSNIYLTQMLSASLEQYLQTKKEYEVALTEGDELLTAAKEVELKVIEGQFHMTSAMFDLWSEHYS
tara:strand:+ start:1335 stop:1607 length:273 start_codon:yes stop_codon:yes gene_type:complete